MLIGILRHLPLANTEECWSGLYEVPVEISFFKATKRTGFACDMLKKIGIFISDVQQLEW